MKDMKLNFDEMFEEATAMIEAATGEKFSEEERASVREMVKNDLLNILGAQPQSVDTERRPFETFMNPPIENKVLEACDKQKPAADKEKEQPFTLFEAKVLYMFPGGDHDLEADIVHVLAKSRADALQKLEKMYEVNDPGNENMVFDVWLEKLTSDDDEGCIYFISENNEDLRDVMLADTKALAVAFNHRLN